MEYLFHVIISVKQLDSWVLLMIACQNLRRKKGPAVLTGILAFKMLTTDNLFSYNS